MAEFRYFLNRQGVRGPQGPQGEKGFSPDISVEKDTLSEYVLRITNEGGYFLTANLREHKEDRGGTYIRYDRATGVMYTGDADPATTDTLGVIRIAKDDDFAGKAEDTAVTPAQVQDYTTAKIAEVNQRIDSLDTTNVKLTGKQTVAGAKTFTDGIVTDRVSLSNGNSVLRPDAGRITIGSTSNTAGTKLEGPYVEVRGTNVDIYGKFTAHGFADFDYNTTFYQDAIIKGSAKDDNNNLYLKQNTITAGDNVQITNTADGIKISSTAQGDVTLAGDNSFTGNNTFDGVSTFNGDTWIDSLKVGTSLKNQQDKLFLSQSSITAGDNVTIEETVDGVKISSTGGGSSEPPANMVTTDTNQTITGIKTFTGRLSATKVSQLKFENSRDSIVDGASGIEIQDNLGVPIFSRYGSESIIVGYSTYDLSLRGKTIKNFAGKNFLAQGSITAGSDNLLITDTTDGVQIICNAPTNAQIEALQRLINDLSTKIDNLTNRVRDLETQIDGGVAGSIYPADPQKIDADPVVDNAINTGETSGSVDITVEDN